jgi:hypothetical protein
MATVKRRVPFNREYQRRATRQGLAEIGIGLVRDEPSGFYRPAVITPPTKRAEKKLGKRKVNDTGQMKLWPLSEFFGFPD